MKQANSRLNYASGARAACTAFVLSFFLTAAAPEHAAAPTGMSRETVTLFNQGSDLMAAGKYQEAAEIFRRVINAFPSYQPAHDLCGQCLLELNQPEAAVPILKRAQALNPADAWATLHLSEAFRQSGQTSEALALLRAFVQTYPADAQAAQMRTIIASVATEVSRSGGAASSRGSLHYLEEALHMGGARWKVAQMPIPVCITGGATVKGYRESLRQIMQRSFQEWAEASGGKVSFRYTVSPADALIICSWVDSSKQLATPDEGGESAPLMTASGDLGRTDIRILTTESEGGAPTTDERIHYVALHEIGHSLGLLGHSSQHGDVMFHTIPPHPQAFLSARDKETLLRLYEAPDSVISAHPLKMQELASVTNATRPEDRAMFLNAQGLEAFNKGRFSEAIGLYRQAIKIAPRETYILWNLAGAYNSIAREAIVAHDLVSADQNLQQAVECFIKSNHKDQALSDCQILIQIAQSRNRPDDTRKYTALKRTIESGK